MLNYNQYRFTLKREVHCTITMLFASFSAIGTYAGSHFVDTTKYAHR